MTNIVHLRACSEYSLLYSAARIDELATKVHAEGMNALGVADRGGLFGPVRVYRTLRRALIAPVLGAVLDVVRERSTRAGREIPAEVVVYALGVEGFSALCQLTTLATLSSHTGERCVTWGELFAHADHLLCLTGGAQGPVDRALATGPEGETDALRRLRRLREVFADRLYVELSDQGMAADRMRNRQVATLARRAGVPVVATSVIRHLHADGGRILDILRGIEQGVGLEESIRMRDPDARFPFLTAEEMSLRFAEHPDALRATAEVAERATITLPVGELHMPHFPTTGGATEIAFLRQIAVEGLARRLPGADSRYAARLAHELQVIEQMGFAGYFLIVWDFIKYAHDQGISTGPGRGSSASSLVAYVLAITDVDPVAHDLLFERFLNPERVSWPDIDIDFEAERRQEVIAYVARKYGADRVAQIGTLGTFAARAAVRDVGRVLQAPPAQIEQLAKLLPNGPGATIEEALKQPDLQALLQKAPSLKRVLDAAQTLEGLPRHPSIHAAGVVIAVEPLTNFTPLMPGTEDTLATQYSMEDIEALGLLKMDFLGLRTLTLCDRTVGYIRAVRGHALEYAEHTFDARTRQLLSSGDTDGCFQLESSGVKHVLRALKPEHLEDLIAVISLYRPGPMEQIGAYIDARRGGILPKIEPPELHPVLAKTHGILIYQEQIMQIAVILAGFTMGEADVLRRAVSKKKREELAEARTKFVAGCRTMGHSEQMGNTVYDLIVRFADYGFPRSHAAAYAVLAYRTAYLKANFRPEFMASLITDSASRPDKVARYVLSCVRAGISVLAPDVQTSGPDCAPVRLSDGTLGLRLGLFAIRHVGVQAVQRLIEQREAEGPFTSLADLVARLEGRSMTRRVLECFIQAGACDCFGKSRRALLTELDAMARPERSRKGVGSNQSGRGGRGAQGELGEYGAQGMPGSSRQMSLPGLLDLQEESPGGSLETLADSSAQQEGQFTAHGVKHSVVASHSLMEQEKDDPKEIEAWEKELLGLVLSQHPYADLRKAREGTGLATIAEELERADGDGILKQVTDRNLTSQTLSSRGALLHVVGQVAVLRMVQTKKGEPMAFLTLEDESARVEIVLFPGIYRSLVNIPVEGQIWEVNARKDQGGKESLLAVNLREVVVASKILYVKIDSKLEQDSKRLAAVRALLKRYPGDDQVILVYESGKARALDAVHVFVGESLLDELRKLIAEDAIRVRDAGE